jgi:hypothetical protein
MAKGSAKIPEKMHGKRVSFDAATWTALDLYARDSMKSFQELADEAFADLLKKHGRPTDLKDALRRSTREISANDNRDAEPTSPTSRKGKRPPRT